MTAFDIANFTPRERRLSLFAVYACIFAQGIGMGLSLPLLSLILERNGVSGTMNGANAAFGAAAMLVFTPFIPALAARVGTVRFLIACYAISALALLAFRATDSLLVWFALRFALNCGLQGLFLVSEVWINQIATDKVRGRLIAIYGSLVSGGFAIGPVILQFMGTDGWAPFVTGASMMALSVIPLILARRLVPPVEHASARAPIDFVFRSPSAALAGLCYGAIEMCLASFLTVYAVRLGESEPNAILLITAWGLGNMLLQLPIGWISDKMDRRVVLIACGVVAVLGAVALPFHQGSGVVALVTVFVWGGCIAALYTVGLAHLGSNFKGGELAAANAAFSILYALGTITGPGLGGLAIDAWNPHGLAVAIGGIAGIFVVLATIRYVMVGRRRAA